MNISSYDFGYAWPWTLGHLLAAAIFAALGLIAWRLVRARRVAVFFGALTAWALAGSAIVNVALRLSLPLALPTEAFLRAGEGRVVDLGAGSGRATVMVLLARPHATVVALDIFSDRYGIDGNTPVRLRANATAAGAAARLEVQTGDMRAMPLASASFDGAVSAYAIDHLGNDDVARTLAETRRVLRPSGEFLLMVLNPDAWVRMALPMFYEHGYFGHQPAPALWRERLETAGFEVVEVGRQPGTLYVLAIKQDHTTRVETGLMPDP